MELDYLPAITIMELAAYGVFGILGVALLIQLFQRFS